MLLSEQFKCFLPFQIFFLVSCTDESGSLREAGVRLGLNPVSFFMAVHLLPNNRKQIHDGVVCLLFARGLTVSAVIFIDLFTLLKYAVPTHHINHITSILPADILIHIIQCLSLNE